MSTNFEDLILRGATGTRPAAGVPGRLFFDTSLSKLERDNGAGWDDVEGGGGAGDMTWAEILASQLVNEIKGWPPIVNSGDLDALNLWWDKEGTPTTAPSVVTTAGEAITETWTHCLKVTADAASEGLFQRFTYADEPRVKAGRVVSALVAIWSVSAVEVTAKLVNSDASHTDASAVTAAAWTIVEIPNHTLAGTYCDLQITAGAAGTFYVVPLGLNIGARGVPLPPRGERFVDAPTALIVNGVDPDGATFADLDLTANTSNLCMAAQIHLRYKNSVATNQFYSRCNGSTASADFSTAKAEVQISTSGAQAVWRQPLDDGQIFEWQTSSPAGDVELVYISVQGYWEWS